MERAGGQSWTEAICDVNYPDHLETETSPCATMLQWVIKYGSIYYIGQPESFLLALSQHCQREEGFLLMRTIKFFLCAIIFSAFTELIMIP